MKQFDVFISHAAEDKNDFVRPLADALSKTGYSVWYDEFTISVGDSLRKAIDNGISNSRFGIVILSKAFFDKGWTNYELDGLIQIDIDSDNEGLILPIWYNINREDVISYSSSLANRYAIISNGTDINRVIKELEKRLGDYFFTVNINREIVRSDKKISIDFLQRDKKFQYISHYLSHKIISKDICIIKSDSIIYPYTKDFKTLKFNYWQENTGHIQLIRHVAYNIENEHLISIKSETLMNSGNNFISSVEFAQQSSGPIRVICEIKTTNLYKSLFEDGYSEVELHHRLRIEHFLFSLYLSNHKDLSNVKVHIEEKQINFSIIPNGRLMQYEIFGTQSPMTKLSLINKKEF